MTSRITITVAPENEPVTLAETKLYLKIDHDAEDDLIALIIATARDAVEKYTKLALITRCASVFFDRWPSTDKTPWWDGMREGVADAVTSGITLPLPPMQSVNSIRIHADNGYQTLHPSNYYADNTDIPGRIVFRSDNVLPQPSRIANGIEISFNAGYGNNAEDVPPPLRQAVLKLTAHLYTHRGDDPAAAISISGVETLLHPYRRMRLS